MKVFVTGATGFVGSAVTAELINSGHDVHGLARSEEKAKALQDMAASIILGDINNLELISQHAQNCDAVIHTAFNHDFSRFKENCEADRKVITALGNALTGTGTPLIITSGIGILNYDHIITEQDKVNQSSDVMPRAASEEAAGAAREAGANVYIVRLPPSTHGEGDHGFVPMLADIAKQTGKAAYIGNGQNRWPAVHRYDAARLYRLIAEQKPSQEIFHAVAEEGIPFKDIATGIGRKLGLPAVSINKEESEGHFGWFSHFASFNCPASSAMTKELLNWEPLETGLLEDIRANYF